MLAQALHTLRKLPRRLAILVDRWHWVLLALASPILLFPSPARSPALLVVPLLWTVAWIARPRAPLPSTPLNVPLLLLMVMVLVSVLVTPDLANSLPKVAGMVLAFGVFFAIAREAQRPLGFWQSLLLVLAIGLGIAGIGIIGTLWGTKIELLASITSRLDIRLIGLPGAEEGFNPNQVAGSLLWVAPSLFCIPVGLVLARRGRNQQALFSGAFRGWVLRVSIAVLTIAALFVLGVFILTQSRTGYFALALTFIMLVVVVLPRRGRWVLLAVMAAGVLAIGIFVSRMGIDVATQQLGLVADATGQSADALSTTKGRMEIWSRAVYGIADFPFTGMGMNSFRRVVHLLYPLFLIGPDRDIAHAHNEFLQAALDLGIPGLIAFLALYVIAGWMLYQTWRGSPREPLSRALVLGLGGGLFSHLVYGLTDAVALGAKPGVLFWMLLGLICGLFSQCYPEQTLRISTMNGRRDEADGYG